MNSKMTYTGYDHQSLFTNLQTQGIAREDSCTIHIENVEHVWPKNEKHLRGKDKRYHFFWKWGYGSSLHTTQLPDS